MEELRNAIRLLYSGDTSADAYLEEFRRSAEAWEVSEQLLYSDDTDEVFFGADTLRSRIIRSYKELPVETHEPLRDSLVAHLTRLCDSEIPRAAVQRISLALADLAIYMEEWRDPVTDLVTAVGGDRVDRYHVLLALVTYLAEEADDGGPNLDITIGRRNQYAASLSRGSVHVIEWLVHCMAPEVRAANPKVTPTRVFRCVFAWLRLMAIDIDQFVSTPLLGEVLDALTLPVGGDGALSAHFDDETFKEAIEIVVELMNQTSDAPDRLPHVVPTLLERGHSMLQLTRDLPDTAKLIVMLFARMGLSYLDFVLASPDDAMPLLSVLEECTSQPPEVAEETFYFWYRFTKLLRHTERDAAPHDRRAATASAPFTPCLSRVLLYFARAAHFPPSDVWQDMDADERDEFSLRRKEISNLFKDVCRIVGAGQSFVLLATTLQSMLEQLVADGADWWIPVEGVLYAMRSIGRFVNVSEPSVSDAASYVFGVLPQLHGGPPRLEYTATLVVSGYSSWLRARPDILPQALELVVGCMRAEASSEVLSAAALAFRNLCETCGGEILARMETGVETIRHVHELNRRGGPFAPSDREDLAAGLSYALAALPDEQELTMLGEAARPLIDELRAMLEEFGATPAPEVLSLHERAVASTLRLITTLSTTAHRESRASDGGGGGGGGAERGRAAAAVFRDTWPLVAHVLRECGTSALLIDESTRYVRHAYTAAAPHLLDLLSDVLLVHLESLGTRPHSTIVYLVAALLRLLVERVGVEFWSPVVARVMEHAFAFLADPRSMEQQPDYVEEFFLFASRVLHLCPRALVGDGDSGGDALATLAQCTLAMMRVRHINAASTVFGFARDALEASERESTAEPVREALRRVFVDEAYVGELVWRVLWGAGGMPPVFLSDLSYLAWAIFGCVGVEAATTVVHRTLAEKFPPAACFGDAQKQEVLERLAGATSASQTGDALRLIQSAYRYHFDELPEQP